MIAPDRTPVPGRSPAPRRVTPDPPTHKITPATTAAAAGSAATTAVAGDQDGDSRFGLSVIQIVASTAAAVTAAVIGSRLGVAGTLTGAALASIVSAVGAAVYGHSLLVTRRHMTKALRLVRPTGATPTTPAGATPAATGAAGRRPSRPTVPGPYDDPTVVIPKAGAPGPAGGAPVPAPADHGARRRGRGRGGLRRQPGNGDAARDRQGRPTVRRDRTVHPWREHLAEPAADDRPDHGHGDHVLDLADLQPGRDGDGDTDPHPEPDPVTDPHPGLHHRRPHVQHPVSGRRRTAHHRPDRSVTEALKCTRAVAVGGPLRRAAHPQTLKPPF